MLKEVIEVKQEPGRRRRWFQDDEIELIVWYGASGGVEGFQLCYRAADRWERALTWRHGTGFTHDRVDLGDTNPFKNQTPILIPDGTVPWDTLTATVQARSGNLEADLSALVLERLTARR